MKETSRQRDVIEKQIEAKRGTPLRPFQANTPYLPELTRSCRRHERCHERARQRRHSSGGRKLSLRGRSSRAGESRRNTTCQVFPCMAGCPCGTGFSSASPASAFRAPPQGGICRQRPPRTDFVLALLTGSLSLRYNCVCGVVLLMQCGKSVNSPRGAERRQGVF